MSVRFEATDVRFALHQNTSAAKVLGRITGAGEPFPVCVWLSLGDAGVWTAFRFEGWRSVPDAQKNSAMLTDIATFCARLLLLLAMHMQRNPDGSGSLAIGLVTVLDEPETKSFGVQRPQLRRLQIHRWDDLWDRIVERIEHDRYFQVVGYAQHEIRTAASELRKVFPADWVRAKCREVGAVHLGADVDPTAPQWFPCYHLARTAHGSLCVDVAWNYLIDLGLSLTELQHFPGFDRMCRTLARSSGTRHHVCLAADFHERGMLVRLEPPMAGSNHLNDMEARLDGRLFHVELKEINTLTTASAMLARVQREIRTKSAEVPNSFALPLIMHFVVIGYAEAVADAERDLITALQNLEGMPPSISAVVAGTRIVSFDGGRPHNSLKLIRINEQAIQPCSEQLVRALFESQRPEPRTPCFALLSSVQIRNEPPPTDA